VVELKPSPQNRKHLLATAVFVLAMLAAGLILNVKAYTFFPEYHKYVHTELNAEDLGNITYIEKPMFPVLLNTSQLQIGQNWSIICPLEANHSYHAYCYGEWVNNGSTPKTDYDIYVYNPLGEMEGYHTEAAGLPEHLGTTTEEPFFVPKLSGNYTFTITNDPRESQGDQQATFMMIEDVECNVWHQHYVEGKDNTSMPILNTSWALEFATESQHVEVWVRVPETLDMYEARIYLMADSKSKNQTVLNGVPLAWEPGLYSERDGVYGGYNLESKEYRGSAYASCEYYGQDMLLNYTSPNSGKGLYHLVFIGEAGSGTIEFLVKTEFGNACLNPLGLPSRVYPENDTEIAYVSNSTDLRNATLQYSINNWINSTSVNMDILDNRTCMGIVPRQSAGAVVKYRVTANDVLENVLAANGSYPVKSALALNMSVVQKTVTIGENLTVRGNVTPARETLLITIYFSSANGSRQVTCYTRSDGTFTATLKPETLGIWQIQARFDGDSALYESATSSLTGEVVEPSIFVQYSVYIGGGIGAAVIVGAVVYWKKSKG
jgi:hypothetical protein